MIKYEDQCCGCAAPGYPCLGNSCSNRNVKIYKCDGCHDEVETLYEYDGIELCLSCVEKRLNKVE